LQSAPEEGIVVERGERVGPRFAARNAAWLVVVLTHGLTGCFGCGECSSSSDCTKGQHCLGVCHDQCPNEGCYGQCTAGCLQTSECATGLVCQPSTPRLVCSELVDGTSRLGQCVPPCSPSAKCSATHCPNSVCQSDGTCAVAPLCRADGDCDAGLVCGHNQTVDPCAPAEICVAGCRSSADCDAGMTCRNASCSSLQCETFRECDAGFACTSAGTCVSGVGPPCDKSQDCDAGLACTSDGRCQPGSACVCDSDCDAGLTCVSRGRCVAAVSCAVSLSCASGCACSGISTCGDELLCVQGDGGYGC
jgi:hypothetical protein